MGEPSDFSKDIEGSGVTSLTEEVFFGDYVWVWFLGDWGGFGSFSFDGDFIGDCGGVFSFREDWWPCCEGVSELTSTYGVFPFLRKKSPPFPQIVPWFLRIAFNSGGIYSTFEGLSHWWSTNLGFWCSIEYPLWLLGLHRLFPLMWLLFVDLWLWIGVQNTLLHKRCGSHWSNIWFSPPDLWSLWPFHPLVFWQLSATLQLSWG